MNKSEDRNIYIYIYIHKEIADICIVSTRNDIYKRNYDAQKYTFVYSQLHAVQKLKAEQKIIRDH